MALPSGGDTHCTHDLANFVISRGHSRLHSAHNDWDSRHSTLVKRLGSSAGSSTDGSFRATVSSTFCKVCQAEGMHRSRLPSDVLFSLKPQTPKAICKLKVDPVCPKVLCFLA